MKFNIYFTIKGSAGVTEAPNMKNPVEHANLVSLLRELSNNLPKNQYLEIETIGIRIEPVE